MKSEPEYNIVNILHFMFCKGNSIFTINLSNPHNREDRMLMKYLVEEEYISELTQFQPEAKSYKITKKGLEIVRLKDSFEKL